MTKTCPKCTAVLKGHRMTMSVFGEPPEPVIMFECPVCKTALEVDKDPLAAYSDKRTE